MVNHLRRIGYGLLPILHMQGHAGTQGTHRSMGHIEGSVVVVLDIEQLLGLGQILQDKLIRIVERRTTRRLRLAVLRANHNTQLVLGRSRIVGFAVALDQLRVAQSTNGIDLAFIIFKVGNALVIGLATNHPLDTLEEEVTVGNHRIECGINRLNLGIGRADIPLPDIAIGIRVAIYGIDQVGLNLGHERQVTAPQRTTHHAGIDTREELLGFVEGLIRIPGSRLHHLLFEQCRLGNLIQTRCQADCCNQQHRIKFHIA